VCHGENGEKADLKGMIPLAGMDAGKLARKVVSYRAQDERHGAYAIYKTNEVMREATYSMSNEQISAIATYLSGLKSGVK
jgi:cytochrome c553